jgi:hypothetical protein
MQPIDTGLDFYLKDTDQFVCLNCTLPICSTENLECAFRQTQGFKREVNREQVQQSRARKKAGISRKEYFQDRYYGKKLIEYAKSLSNTAPAIT